MNEASYKEISEYLKKTPTKRADMVLSTLGKSGQFRKALESPIGRELLDDLLSLMEERLDKIANMKETEEDKYYYRAYKELSDRWLDRINQHSRLTSEVKEIASK